MDNIDYFIGAVGMASRITAPPATINQTATLGAWLLHLPGQHPLWNHYMLSVVHLRPIDGGRPVYRRYPEAEYELNMFALDPKAGPKPDDMATLYPLEPVNYVEQFHNITDEQAVRVGARLVEMLVHGLLFAEPSGIVGARALWARAFEAILGEVRES